MKFSRSLFVPLGPDVPASIRAQLMLNAINVEFEQEFIPQSQKTELSYDDLFIWCSQNCSSLFSCFKSSHAIACFMFYETTDMQKFESYLTKSVTHAAGSVT